MWYAENTKAFLAMKGIIYSGIGHYTQNWKVPNSESQTCYEAPSDRPVELESFE